MSRDDVIRMAQVVGASTGARTIWPPTFKRSIDFNMHQLERFAALVAARATAAEREACAKVCESLFDMDDDSCTEAEECVAAIRARGTHEQP